MKYHLLGNDFILSPLKCIYWLQENCLLLSDIHFGKTNHFRKNGIPITSEVATIDYVNLAMAIYEFKPMKIIVIGDLFHSLYNNEVEIFKNWKKQFRHLKWILIKGNHDILQENILDDLEMEVCESITIQNFCFMHEMHQENFEDSLFYFTGHVHPGVKKFLGAGQSKSFPCFFFNNKIAILPAFGAFTGLHLLKTKKSDDVFGIVNDNIIKF